MDGAGDWFRAILGIGALAVFIMLIWRVSFVWSRFSGSQKMVFLALLFYVGGIGWRSWDLVINNNLPFSLTLVPYFIGHTIMLVYLFEPRRRYSKRLGVDLRDPPERNKKENPPT